MLAQKLSCSNACLVNVHVLGLWLRRLLLAVLEAAEAWEWMQP